MKRRNAQDFSTAVQVGEWYTQKYTEMGGSWYAPPDELRTHLTCLGLKSGKSILDIGCGTGELLEVARTMGAFTFGCDMSQYAYDTCNRKNLSVVMEPMEALPWQAETFDFCIGFGSMEHSLDIPAAVREMARVLKTGGKWLLYVPNEFWAHDDQPLETTMTGEEWAAILRDAKLTVDSIEQINDNNRIIGHKGYIETYKGSDMNPILCPLRNGRELTKAAHATFLAQDIDGGVQILYINNASTDGTIWWLQTTNAFVIHNLAPRGVAASWNQGLRWLFAKGAEHVLVVNNDVRLRPDTYRHLLAAGGLFVTAVGSNDPNKILPPYDPPSYTDIRFNPDYSCYLIRREAYDRMGAFDEGYSGGYAEDADSHLRLHNIGIEPYCLELPFWHLGAGTLKNASKEEAADIIKKADANRKRFRDRYGVEVGSDGYYALFGPSGKRPPENAPYHDNENIANISLKDLDL